MKHLHCFLLLAALGLNLVKADPLAVGAKAPAVTTIDQDGASVDFAKIYESGLTLVYFYPKAGSAACTSQACSLRDTFKQIRDKGITVIGVSNDKPESQKNFKERYELPFTLIPDSDHSVANAFGVPTMLFGWDKRQSFLIKNGKIVWEDLDVNPSEHTAKVLQAADRVSKSS